MTTTHGPFPSIERVEVDPVAIAAYTREWDFMVLASELLREVASYVCIAACTLGAAPAWTRDQAAVGGNMVRLFKLLSAFLDQTVQKRYKTSTIISRLTFETIVNARRSTTHFQVNIVYAEGGIVGSNIAQGSPGAHQSIEPLTGTELRELIEELQRTLDQATDM